MSVLGNQDFFFLFSFFFLNASYVFVFCAWDKSAQACFMPVLDIAWLPSWRGPSLGKIEIGFRPGLFFPYGGNCSNLESE
ncbi:hypothetical protein HDV63DRAFT_363176 [Trichoderma sp. SZMC 28014]